MKTNITSISELKNIFLEIFFSKTSKVNKVSSTSILNAIAYGISKIGQKCLKEIAIIEAQLFPEYATGDTLNAVGERYGLGERLGAISSTVYIYLYGNSGTTYNKNSVIFTSSEGINFRLDQNITLNACKYAYAKAYSEQKGEKTNVAPLTITSCVNAPSGHLFCTNEFAATGGRNIESDEDYQYRIKNIHNILATKTLNYLTQIGLKINPNIMKFVNLGTYRGKIKLGVYTQSGAALSENEISVLRAGLQDYLALSDISDNLNSRIYLENVDYAPIRLSFRIDFDKNLYSSDEIYSKIQRALVNFIDWRYWDCNQKVGWAQLLDIVEHTEGVLNCPVSTFLVNDGKNDIEVSLNKLPRFQSCLIYDINGNTLINTTSVQYMPVIYPVYANENFNILT